jgi:hypothetical protein
LLPLGKTVSDETLFVKVIWINMLPISIDRPWQLDADDFTRKESWLRAIDAGGMPPIRSGARAEGLRKGMKELEDRLEKQWNGETRYRG